MIGKTKSQIDWLKLFVSNKHVCFVHLSEQKDVVDVGSCHHLFLLSMQVLVNYEQSSKYAYLTHLSFTYLAICLTGKVTFFNCTHTLMYLMVTKLTDLTIRFNQC